MMAVYSMKPIFSYLDYRTFVREFYLEWKAKDEKYSYRYWASRAGFASPNFIKLIIDGKRNLSASGSAQLAKAFALNLSEKKFFMDLVELNQCQGAEARVDLAKKLLKNPALLKAFPLKNELFEYYSEWYHIVLREMLLDPKCSQNPEPLARRLRPKITVDQVRQGLSLLLPNPADKKSSSHINSPPALNFTPFFTKKHRTNLVATCNLNQ